MNQPFGFVPGEDGKFDINSLGAMLQQLGAMMQQTDAEQSDGAVSWAAIKDAARAQIAKAGDPSVTAGEAKSVADAVTLAQTWLESQTTLPALTTNSNAWSRSEWIENTIQAWQPMINPVAEGLQRTMTQNSPQLTDMGLPAEMQQMIEPVMQMAKKIASAQTSMQIGNGLGVLSGDLLANSDIAAPLTTDFAPALFPTAISQFANEHELPIAEVMVYIAIREAAFNRLFANNLWLQSELPALIATYARGIEFDSNRISEVMTSLDPSDPSSMQELMQSGVFEPTRSESQNRAIEKMEFTIALVEGWVSAVTAATVSNRLEHAAALNETFLRRQLFGGPAAKTFANLVGLELRPKLLRSTINFWNQAVGKLGIEKRDWLFSHPDLLPTIADLEELENFFQNFQAE